MVWSDCSFDLYRMELFKRFSFLKITSTPTEIQPSPVTQKKIHSWLHPNCGLVSLFGQTLPDAPWGAGFPRATL